MIGWTLVTRTWKFYGVESDVPELPEGDVLVELQAVVSLLLRHVIPPVSGGWGRGDKRYAVSDSTLI